jgi:hypothetical protein
MYIKKNENHPSGCGYGSIRAKLHYTIWLEVYNFERKNQCSALQLREINVSRNNNNNNNNNNSEEKINNNEKSKSKINITMIERERERKREK